MPANFTGTWHANLSQSRLLTPAPVAITAILHHTDPDLHQEMLVTRPDGGEDHLTLQSSTDGEEGKCLLNGNPVRGTARWLGDELLIEIWVQIGQREMHFCDYWSFSPDSNTLRMEHRNDDLAGQLTIYLRAA